jgi:hypothetical protein
VKFVKEKPLAAPLGPAQSFPEIAKPYFAERPRTTLRAGFKCHQPTAAGASMVISLVLERRSELPKPSLLVNAYQPCSF